MPLLKTAPNISDPDEFYATLLDAHDNLSPEESSALNARLILILANQVGDMGVLNEAICAATKHVRS